MSNAASANELRTTDPENITFHWGSMVHRCSQLQFAIGGLFVVVINSTNN